MAVLFFCYGACMGSFANVLIYRMQRPGPLQLFKKSHCPACLYPIPFYLNIPILSWFLLRGKCQNCKKAFSFRYPLVEFLTAFLFSALFLSLGWKWFLLEALIFAFALIVAGFIDWDQMILPDSLTLSGISFGLLGALLNPERPFISALLGMILGGGALSLAGYGYQWFRKKEGMGGGDIKMMAWIGAVLGWESLFFVLLLACLSGSLIGFAFFGLRGRGKGQGKQQSRWQTPFPFGPYLAVSALLYIFFQSQTPTTVDLFMPF